MVLILVLGGLLVVTTPVGTGQGIHQSELLHPLLPHLHLVAGRLVTHDQLEDDQAPPAFSPSGPALGAGSAADAAGLGLAISPTLPEASVALLLSSFTKLSRSTATLPTEFRDTPPDPPPNRLA